MSTTADLIESKFDRDPLGFFRGEAMLRNFMSSADMSWCISELPQQKEATLILSGTGSFALLESCLSAFAHVVLEVSDEDDAQKVAAQFASEQRLTVVLGTTEELTGATQFLRIMKERPAEGVAEVFFYYDIPAGMSALLQADFAESEAANHFIEELNSAPSCYISTSLDIPFYGMYMSKQRPPRFRSVSLISKAESGQIHVHKKPCLNEEQSSEAVIQIQACSSEWIKSPSLEQMVLQNSTEQLERSLSQQCEIAKPWLQALQGVATEDGRVPASFFDACWNNCFLEQEKVTFVDQEWLAEAPLPLNYIVIRSIFQFLIRNEDSLRKGYQYTYRNFYASITAIAAAIGCTLSKSDFATFEHMESKIQAFIMEKPQLSFLLKLKLRLRFPAWYRLLRRLQ